MVIFFILFFATLIIFLDKYIKNCPPEPEPPPPPKPKGVYIGQIKGMSESNYMQPQTVFLYTDVEREFTPKCFRNAKNMVAFQ